MKVEISPYVLTSIENGCKRRGTLLRIQFPEGIGYADCHPWPELGDDPLEEQLKKLQHNRLTQLTQQSLHFAKIDALARTENRFLFNHLKIPPSHFFVGTFFNFEKKTFPDRSILKIKMGNNLDTEEKLLNKYLPILEKRKCKLRLDFNEKLTEKSFRKFLDYNSDVFPFVEFFEDPFPYSPNEWEKIQQDYSIRLACDRQVLEGLRHPSSCQVLIVKPAIQKIEPFLSDDRDVVVTSYLDHPIGQLCATYFAAQLGKKLNHRLIHCGLLSHHAYTLNPFSSAFIEAKGRLIPSKGTGWGYNELLEGASWIPL